MQFKPFFQSKTLIGVFVALLGFIGNALHVNLVDLLPQVGPALLSFVANAVQLIGLVVAVIGRFKARGPLTVLPSSSARLNSVATAMRVLIAFAMIGAGCWALVTLTACNGLTAGQQQNLNADLSTAKSYAWTVANALQTTDGEQVTSDILSTSLQLAGASPKTVQEAAIAKKLTDDTLKLATTAHAIGASSDTLKTSQAALLADPAVVGNAAAAAPAPAAPSFQPAALPGS